MFQLKNINHLVFKSLHDESMIVMHSQVPTEVAQLSMLVELMLTDFSILFYFSA